MTTADQTRSLQRDSHDPDRVAGLLVGAVDLHCHSGPSVMPRCIDHIEAMKQAADVGFRAVLIKDHYYSASPVTQLVNHPTYIVDATWKTSRHSPAWGLISNIPCVCSFPARFTSSMIMTR